MKKALIVIALVIILLCSLAVSGIPFNLVVGKEGAVPVSFGGTGPSQFNFQSALPAHAFVRDAALETSKQYYECGGKWYPELFNLGALVSTGELQDFCKSPGCWKTSTLNFVSADEAKIKVTSDFQNRFQPSGWYARTFAHFHYCTFTVGGNINFIQGKRVPFAVSSKSEIIPLGTVGDLLGNFVFTETGTDFAIASDNPKVLVWVGGQFADPMESKTDMDTAEVWACYDGDQDQKCDFAEDNRICSSQGGDHYNDVCCGVDISTAGDVIEFNGHTVNALCARTTAGDWAWVDTENVGEIFNLQYPGKTVVSDGSKLISCEKGKDSVRVSTKYGTHNYLCLADRMFECSGGRPFSTSNVASLGSDSRALSKFFCPVAMVAYWSFDSDSGVDVKNEVGDFAKGNANGVSFVPGRVGNAALFDLPSDDIQIPGSEINLTFPTLTIEAWIRPSSIAGKHTILNKEHSYELYLDGGILKASLYSDGSPASAFLAASSPITNDVWSHVSLVYDGSGARIYHNGQSVASAALTGNINASTQPFKIGAREFTPEPFAGLIDEVALYSVPLSHETVQSHYFNHSSYCGVANISGVYYCASDGDWTKDLDIKDELSCRSAGFNWTGSKCCSELDDIDESYSDISTPAASIGNIAGEKSNADLISDYSIALNSVDSFVVINGPAKISIVHSSFRSDRGETVFCEDKEVSSFDLLAGQSKRITNYDYPDINHDGCTIGRTVVSSLPTLAQGGCFKKNFYPSGSFLYEKSVINANGEFVACKQSPAGLQQYSFIRTQATPCGKPINDVFPGQAAVCLPSGSWHFIDNADETSVAQTSWDPADFNIAAYKQGCCPADKCWNGTGCQPGDTYYSIENKGFVCK